MSHIAIVDYGMGNLHSVQQALSVLVPAGTRLTIVKDKAGIRNADKIVFPGQGAAADCMRAIKAHGLGDALVQAAQEKPFLGICMGLQVLLAHSLENGGTPCLQLFTGEVRHLAEHKPACPGHKIPHTGWNQVRQKASHPLWQGIDDNEYFYFVHSYYVVPDDDKLVSATTEYGNHFASAIADKNVFAVQFHPEKSAECGLQLLKNFIQWRGESQV